MATCGFPVWIFFLFVTVNSSEYSSKKRQCVIFNIPHILCAPDISQVSVTPYYEYVTIPKFANLLGKGSEQIPAEHNSRLPLIKDSSNLSIPKGNTEPNVHLPAGHSIQNSSPLGSSTGYTQKYPNQAPPTSTGYAHQNSYGPKTSIGTSYPQNSPTQYPVQNTKYNKPNVYPPAEIYVIHSPNDRYRNNPASGYSIPDVRERKNPFYVDPKIDVSFCDCGTQFPTSSWPHPSVHYDKRYQSRTKDFDIDFTQDNPSPLPYNYEENNYGHRGYGGRSYNVDPFSQNSQSDHRSQFTGGAGNTGSSQSGSTWSKSARVAGGHEGSGFTDSSQHRGGENIDPGQSRQVSSSQGGAGMVNKDFNGKVDASHPEVVTEPEQEERKDVLVKGGSETQINAENQAVFPESPSPEDNIQPEPQQTEYSRD